MVTSQTIRTQLKVYQDISSKSASNPNYLSDLRNSINSNNVKEFNRLTGKKVTKISSAEGYLRLYQSYVNIVVNQTTIRKSSVTTTITSKPVKKTTTSKQKGKKSTTSKQKGKKSTTYKQKGKKSTTSKQKGKKSTTSKQKGKKGSSIKINLYPFSNYSKSTGLNLIITKNRSFINNNNRNTNTILNYFANIQNNIAVYNSTHSNKILMVRVTIKYFTNLRNTAYYSTKRLDVNQIESAVNTMMNDLTLFISPQHWQNLYVRPSEIVEDLYNKKEQILGYELFEIKYFTR